MVVCSFEEQMQPNESMLTRACLICLRFAQIPQKSGNTGSYKKSR